MDLLAHQINQLQQQQPQPQVPRDFKTPDIDPFKGDPEDLDRFLLQLEDKFSMEPTRFSTDLMKIKYAGQRLKDKAYKWYRSYHLQISQREDWSTSSDPVFENNSITTSPIDSKFSQHHLQHFLLPLLNF